MRILYELAPNAPTCLVDSPNLLVGVVSEQLISNAWRTLSFLSYATIKCVTKALVHNCASALCCYEILYFIKRR